MTITTPMDKEVRDVVIFVQDKQPSLVTEPMERENMNVNAKKTVILTFSRRRHRELNLYISGKTIKIVNDVKYLGQL